jgi:hypothetical protein
MFQTAILLILTLYSFSIVHFPKNRLPRQDQRQGRQGWPRAQD